MDTEVVKVGIHSEQNVRPREMWRIAPDLLEQPIPRQITSLPSGPISFVNGACASEQFFSAGNVRSHTNLSEHHWVTCILLFNILLEGKKLYSKRTEGLPQTQRASALNVLYHFTGDFFAGERTWVPVSKWYRLANS